MRQFRVLAPSPRCEEGENNAQLCSRLGILMPFEKLCLSVFHLWHKRLLRPLVVDGNDILVSIPQLCERVRSQKLLLWKRWHKCLPVWQKHISLTDTSLVSRHDMNLVLRELGLEAGTQTTPSSDPPIAEPIRPTNAALLCDMCQAEFQHQMALRLHMRSLHGIIANASTPFRMD